MSVCKRASLTFLISILLYVGLSVGLSFVIGNEMDDMAYLLSAVAVSVPAFLIPAVIFRKTSGIGIDPAPRFSHIVLAVLIGVGCVFMNEALAFLNNAVFMGIDIESNSTTASDILNLNGWNMLLSLAMIPAVSEEFIMRGCLCEAYRRSSVAGAMFLTALLFGLLHSAPSSMLIYIGLGLLLAGVYLITRNVWMSAIVHFVNNLASVLSALAMRSIVEGGPSGGYDVLSVPSEIDYLINSRVGSIFLFFVYGAAAAIFLVPFLILLNSSCRTRRLGRYAVKKETVYQDGVEAPLPDGAIFGSAYIWIAIGLLLLLNVFAALQEFGVIAL